MSKGQVKVDLSGIKPRFRKQFERANAALTEQVFADSTEYVPVLGGDLRGSGRKETRPGEGTVMWGGGDVPYAAAQYYSTAPKGKAVNSKAVGKWFEAAKAAKGSQWIKMAKDIAGGKVK